MIAINQEPQLKEKSPETQKKGLVRLIVKKSDSSDGCYHRRKRRTNKKICQKKDSIKLCARLMAKLLTTAYKSTTMKFKLDEYLIQRLICFLTFVESLGVIFPQYKETCEVLLYYPKIGGDNIKYFVKKAIKNILHANIDVRIRRLITEFPVDGVKCIETIQTHCSNMNFSDKSRCTGLFNKSHIN